MVAEGSAVQVVAQAAQAARFEHDGAPGAVGGRGGGERLRGQRDLGCQGVGRAERCYLGLHRASLNELMACGHIWTAVWL